MKKFKVLFISLTVLALGLSGCTLFGPEEPTGDYDEIVKEAFKNMYNIKSCDYSVDMNGSFDTEGQEVDFDIAMSGVQDLSDLTNPKFTLKFEGSGSAPDYANESVDAEIRLTDNVFYFVLNNASSFGGNIPSEMIEPYIGQWYSMVVPEGTFGDNQFSIFADDEDLTPNQKAMKDLLENTSFFKDIAYVGNEDGRQVYSAVLDKDATLEFMTESLKIEGQSMTDSEMEDAKKGLDASDLNVKIGIDPELNAVSMISGSLKVEAPEEAGEASFDFEVVMDNLGEAITVEVPSSAKEFDPMMIFGAMTMMDGEMGEY
jgi:hypothetical protein